MYNDHVISRAIVSACVFLVALVAYGSGSSGSTLSLVVLAACAASAAWAVLPGALCQWLVGLAILATVGTLLILFPLHMIAFGILFVAIACLK